MSAPPRPPDSPEDLSAVLLALRPEGAAWPPPDWVRLLFHRESPRFELICASARAEPLVADRWLAAIVDEDDLSFERAVGGGQAPTTAAEVLAAVPGPEGIAALVRALARTDEDEFLHIAALDTLAAIGEPAIEPLCAARTGFPPGSVERDTLTDAIALHPGPHPRIRDVLVEVLNEDVQHGAALCSVSEDPEIVAILRALWDAYEVVESEEAVDENAAGRALGHALRDLHAPWTGEDEAKFERILDWIEESDDDDEEEEDVDEGDTGVGPGGEATTGRRELRDDLRDDLSDALDEARRLKRPDGTPVADREAFLNNTPVDPLVRRETPGRNDPCWCGSGKKYKKCHLDADGA